MDVFDKTISQILGKTKNLNKEVGVEVEVELAHSISLSVDEGVMIEFANNLSGSIIWKATADYSLKKNGYEFVSMPMGYKDVDEAMLLLKTQLNQMYMGEIEESVRAGVHIHINMLQSSLKELMQFYLVYSALETPLTRFCGFGREGNLFCLRNRDAEYQSFSAMNAISVGDIKKLKSSGNSPMRYGSMNFQSLFSYGTVEFRALSTDKELKKIAIWIDILRKIKDYSAKMDSPVDFLNEISQYGPQNWAQKILGAKLYKHVKCEGFDQEVITDSRIVQPAAFLLKKKVNE